MSTHNYDCLNAGVWLATASDRTAGFFLLLLFGLQYLGVLEVRWDRIGDWFENVGPWLGAQTSSFRAFILGSLPSTASGAAGLVIGFRQRR